MINDTVYRVAAKELNDANQAAAEFDDIEGLGFLDKVVAIDQSPIGAPHAPIPPLTPGCLPRSASFSPAPRKRAREVTRPVEFSFNVRGGRCEACGGDGVTKVEMHFLPDIYVSCDVCKGKRYNRETSRYPLQGPDHPRGPRHDGGGCGVGFFDAVPAVKRKLTT